MVSNAFREAKAERARKMAERKPRKRRPTGAARRAMAGLPRVSRVDPKEADPKFPFDTVSYSTLRMFSCNPVMFRITKMNGERLDTPTGSTGLVGRAFHRAMERYYGGALDEGEGKPGSAGEAVQRAIHAGLETVEEWPEAFVRWTAKVPDRAKAKAIVSDLVTTWNNEVGWGIDGVIETEPEVREMIDVEWRGQRLRTPVPLRGFIDKVRRTEHGVEIDDYKTCASFSSPDRIDGAKLLQSVEYFFLAWVMTGEPPVAINFYEVKYTANRDGGPRVRSYRVEYAKHEMAFDLWFRLYTDMIRAVNGEAVFPPNLDALYDNEVSLVAYIQRLDVPEEVARIEKDRGVRTITELLRDEIADAANMKKLIATLDGVLERSAPIDYASMPMNERIVTKLAEFGILLRYQDTISGATVDLHRFVPTTGVRVRELGRYADDIALACESPGVRIAPILGSRYVGIEVPRPDDRRFPSIPGMSGYDLAIGETIDGQVRRFDIRTAPHMLVAGSSGSGKSVFLHSMIRQLTAAGADVRPVDPKRVEFGRYGNTVSDHGDVEAMLAYLCDEMESRYDRLAQEGHRDALEAGWKPIVVVIDEYADLAMSKKSEVPTLVQRIAQKGRAAGIHIVLATQRASTKVVTGDVKVNFPVKAVFRMAKAADSQVMIDEDGAERLLGKGDMLFATEAGTERLQAYSGL